MLFDGKASAPLGATVKSTAAEQPEPKSIGSISTCAIHEKSALIVTSAGWSFCRTLPASLERQSVAGCDDDVVATSEAGMLKQSILRSLQHLLSSTDQAKPYVHM